MKDADGILALGGLVSLGAWCLGRDLNARELGHQVYWAFS